jgi:hypothetical protein
LSDIGLEIADRKSSEWNKVGLGAFDATERVDAHFGVWAFDAKELRGVAEAIEARGSIVWLGGNFDCRMKEFLAGDFPGSQVELVVAQGRLKTVPVVGPVGNLVLSCLKTAAGHSKPIGKRRKPCFKHSPPMHRRLCFDYSIDS